MNLWYLKPLGALGKHKVLPFGLLSTLPGQAHFMRQHNLQ